MPDTDVSVAEPLPWPCKRSSNSKFPPICHPQPKLPCAQAGSCELCTHAAGIIQAPLDVSEQLLLVLLVVLNLLLQGLRSVHAAAWLPPELLSTGQHS
jgi:hypothetical protein